MWTHNDFADRTGWKFEMPGTMAAFPLQKIGYGHLLLLI